MRGCALAMSEAVMTIIMRQVSLIINTSYELIWLPQMTEAQMLPILTR